MIRINHFLLALAAAGMLTACTTPAPTGDSSNQTTNPAPTAKPGEQAAAPADPDAKAIFASYRTDPNFVKVNTSPIKSGPHMGDVDIWVDKANAGQYKTVGAQAPDGMTVVKASVQEPQRAYIMKKIKGYDPANGDWYYANTKADGQIEMTGKPQMCITCHAGYKPTDYLATPAAAKDQLQ